jgi:hypothetical protein
MWTLSTLGGAAGAFLVLAQGLSPNPIATLAAAWVAGLVSWCFTALVIFLPVTALFLVAQIVVGLYHGFSRAVRPRAPRNSPGRPGAIGRCSLCTGKS